MLGFHELDVDDVRSHKYAVVSDGELCIGLNDLHAEDGPAVTFVHENLAREASSMSDHGFDFHTLQLDEDKFNELALRCPDGHVARMIEARTFARPDETDESRPQ